MSDPVANDVGGDEVEIRDAEAGQAMTIDLIGDGPAGPTATPLGDELDPAATPDDYDDEAVAKAAIMELRAARDAGEISEADFLSAVRPHAQVIADAHARAEVHADQKAKSGFDFLFDLIETRPWVLREVAAGVVIGLNHYGLDVASWRKGA